MEDYFLNLTVISLIIPIINAAINLQPFQKNAQLSALLRNHNQFVIILTRACQHLTLYSQFWTIVALYHKTHLTMFIAQTISILTFVMYHGFNYFDSKYLAYHPKELVDQVISFTPPMNKYIVIWIGLHFQHSIFPFYIYYMSNKYNLMNYEPYMLFYSFAIMIIYILWHIFCWKVQGIAAYPFLNELNTHTTEYLFYCFGSIVFMTINCIVCKMHKELFFYTIGIVKCFLIYCILKYIKV